MRHLDRQRVPQDGRSAKTSLHSSFESGDKRLPLTHHANRRMAQRSITAETIELAIEYGRAVYTRGAVVYAVGRNEIARWAQDGIDLTRHDGIQVVCDTDGTVITAYRNRCFRGLRTGLGRGRHRRSHR